MTRILKWIAWTLVFLLHLAVVVSMFEAPAGSAKWRVVRVLTGWGSAVWFLGPGDVGRNFFHRGHWVNAPSPEEAWRVLAVVLWSAAILLVLVWN